jgi:hypothetical protein
MTKTHELFVERRGWFFKVFSFDSARGNRS